MGVTIHYALKTKLTDAGDVRELVESLRLFARGLPFAEVSDVVEFRGEQADFEKSDRDDPFRWLKIQAREVDRTRSKPLPGHTGAPHRLQHLARRGLRGRQLRPVPLPCHHPG